MAYFPFFTDIEGQRCVIAGGGRVALQKAEALLGYGPGIRVIAPEICGELKALEGKIEICLRPFEEQDLEGADFAVAASGDQELNRRLSLLCREKKIPVNVVDQKEECSFIFPALLRRRDITVGISTGGKSPTAAKYLKQAFQDAIPDCYEELVEELGAYREPVKERVESQTARSRIFKELADLGIAGGGRIDPAAAERLIERYEDSGQEPDGGESGPPAFRTPAGEEGIGLCSVGEGESGPSACRAPGGEGRSGPALSAPAARLRPVSGGDLDEFYRLMRALDEETRFMLYEPGERPESTESLKRLISRAVSGPDFLMMAEGEDGSLVGFLSAQRGDLKRVRHTAYVVTGIRRAYRGLGIGTELFKRLDAWAQDQGVLRLELTVMCRNEAALRLYRKSGFETEGIRRGSMIVDGEWVDEYYMAKIRKREDGEQRI